MALSDLYREAVLEHNRNPRHHHELAGATHSARGFNAICGDDIRVELVIEDAVIVEAAFTGEASAITTASASMMTERVRGLSIEQALALFADLQHLVNEAGVDPAVRQRLGELAALEGVRDYPSRVHSATLAWAALKAAVEGREVASTES